MIKWIAPIFRNLRHLSQPHMFRVRGEQPTATDAPSRGQQLAERVATFVGSWFFLSTQAGFLLLWLIYNTLLFTNHFDPPPYILLNLLLSFQAAFTGPVLLIAANVGAIRDHAQANRIEQLAAQNEKLSEQNAQLVERLLNVEQMMDVNLKQHATMLAELFTLLQAVHACVVPSPSSAISADGAQAATTSAIPVAAGIVEAAPPADDPASHAAQPARKASPTSARRRR